MARPYIPVEIERRVRNQAKNRCAYRLIRYCLNKRHIPDRFFSTFKRMFEKLIFMCQPRL